MKHSQVVDKRASSCKLQATSQKRFGFHLQLAANLLQLLFMFNWPEPPEAAQVSRT